MLTPTDTNDQVLLSRRDGRVAWLVLNRPRALNALDEGLLRCLDRELAVLAEEEEEVGAVVITGAGHRAFCFGADLRALDGDSPAARRGRLAALLPVFQGVIRRLEASPAPVIAALNGFATGAGFDLALACDLRIAATGAKLGSAFTGLGLVPDGGGTYHLPRLVGLGRALELTLLADAVDARTALEIGLVNRLVEPRALESTAAELAARLAAAPRPAASEARRLLRRSGLLTFDEALAAEAAAQLRCATSPAFTAAIERRARRRPSAS